MQKRISDFGIDIGILKRGKNNKITDVKNVLVGHHTIKDNDIQTGVTAVLPHKGNIFKEKVTAAAHVINGFGKSTGLTQIEEMGTIETPIVLTNTLNVGTAFEAIVEYTLKDNGDIGITTGTLNPIVCECNDMFLNDIRGMHVKKENVLDAITNASEAFAEGAVGGGTGMASFQLKGGIGSSSRVFSLGDKQYTVGVLVQANFGLKRDLRINDINAGKWLEENKIGPVMNNEKGSVIVIVATDLPLVERQLKRVIKRAAVGLTRTGSYIGNGSGDIVIGFTTSNNVQHGEKAHVTEMTRLNEDYIDYAFRAVAESTEEAVLNALITAETTVGRGGNTFYSLQEYIKDILK